MTYYFLLIGQERDEEHHGEEHDEEHQQQASEETQPDLVSVDMDPGAAAVGPGQEVDYSTITGPLIRKTKDELIKVTYFNQCYQWF